MEPVLLEFGIVRLPCAQVGVSMSEYHAPHIYPAILGYNNFYFSKLYIIRLRTIIILLQLYSVALWVKLTME